MQNQSQIEKACISPNMVFHLCFQHNVKLQMRVLTENFVTMKPAVNKQTLYTFHSLEVQKVDSGVEEQTLFTPRNDAKAFVLLNRQPITEQNTSQSTS